MENIEKCLRESMDTQADKTGAHKPKLFCSSKLGPIQMNPLFKKFIPSWDPIQMDLCLTHLLQLNLRASKTIMFSLFGMHVARFQIANDYVESIWVDFNSQTITLAESQLSIYTRVRRCCLAIP